VTNGQAMTANDFAQRLSAWRHKFRHYREPPQEDAIRAWLEAFLEEDRDVASKVLDHVTVLSENEVQAGYKLGLESLPGWHVNPANRQGRWFFIGFGGAGESGPAMLRLFREANNLALRKFDDLFCTISELPRLRLTARDNVVFVDDFSGSGRQVVTLWPKIEELVASEATCYLLLSALTGLAKETIEAATSFRIVCNRLLGAECAVFDEQNSNFSVAEKSVIERYCRIADPAYPRGVGNLGIVFILHHKSANNCLPILHINKPYWRGLFPRYLRAA
jgi:hypothetical protein